MALHDKVRKLAGSPDISLELRQELRKLLAGWDEPEFVEAVEVLAPHVAKIQKYLQDNTTIPRWTTGGANPSHSMRGKGALARFSGVEPHGSRSPRASWAVEVSVVGDEVRVEACPERTYYPGWNCTFVAGGKVRDLANPKRIFYTAGLPLDLIMKDPIY